MTDWALVKKMTLWDYEELIEKISDVFSYSFVQQRYDHNMREAIGYARKLFGYDPKYAKRISRIAKTLKTLNGLKVGNYTDLVHDVENKRKCEDFLRRTPLSFQDLIFLLNYIFRWVLPHRLYLSELIDTENERYKDYVERLRLCGTRFNLDILEHGRTSEGREKLVKNTKIPRPFIFNLVNLADMSRLPFSNRKTVRHLLAGGYGSMTKLAQTDSEKLVEDMRLYFEGIGIRLSGFIDLKGIARWAKTVPIVLED